VVTFVEAIAAQGRLPADGARDIPFTSRLVDVFDTNCDGTIDFREAVIGLSTFLRGSPEARVAQVFEALDADGDGKVSRSELLGALDARASLSWRMSTSDTAEGMDTIADRILAAGDLDGDGQLSIVEFLTMLEAQPEIQSGFAIAEAARLFNRPAASWNDRKVALEIVTSVMHHSSSREGIWTAPGGLATDAAVQALFRVPGLSPVAIGEFLGGRDETGFCRECAAQFFAEMNLEGTTLDGALRLMSKRLCLPGEAQQIDRLMSAFSQVYYRSNPNVFVDEDAAYITAFAIVMLNTDAHSPNNTRKMTKQEFVRNVPSNVERLLLEAAYDRVVHEEIRLQAAETLGVATEAGLVPRLSELAWGEFSRALDALGGA
jgi:Ca2+-binding EF-hand superfamily protein